MARVIENDCCGCAVPGYPCRGELCHRRNAEHVICDECGEDTTNKFFVYGDNEFCEGCILDVLVEDGVIGKEKR